MNTQQARALIGETFPQTFDRERFRYFAVNLLNHIICAVLGVQSTLGSHLHSYP